MSQTTLNPRSRSVPTPRTPKTKWVCFRLGQETYGISIHAVQHILQEYVTHGILASGQSLTSFRDQQVMVVDLAHLFQSSADSRPRHYLIICVLSSGETVGIPVPDMPTILETTLDTLQTLPVSYRQAGIPSVIEHMLQTPGGTPIFLLHPDHLTLPHPQALSKPESGRLLPV